MARLSLPAKIVAYLALVHAALGTAAFVALRDAPVLLVVVEGLFVVSLVAGAAFLRAFFVPLGMIRTGAELIQERDFTARFQEVGQPEMDDLIRIYNRMIERLREERLAVEERNSFLAKVLEASPAGVVTLDFDGRIALVNPAAERFLRRPSSLLVGRRLDGLDAPLARALEETEAGSPRVVAAEGRRRLKCARAVFFDRGHPRTFFVLEELTEELRASERAAWEKLVRIISHEVNNSVGAVVSLMDTARHYAGQLRDEDREDFRRALEIATTRMENLGTFMRGFAEVVRLPAPSRRPVDLVKMLDDVLALMGPEMARRGIRLSRPEPPGPIPSVEADPVQIEQVLVNVVKNAVEAIGRDGEVTARIDLDAGRPVLGIADTGPGLDPDVRANLFAPFFSTKRDGRGLGLTVIQEILGAHRFEFSLENREEGGAEFRIRFA